MADVCGRDARDDREEAAVGRAVVARAERQALYVMQTAAGAIKVGRSINPEQRRRNLETGSGRRVHLVACWPGRGAEEPAILAALREHRGLGEWFANTKAARLAIEAAVGQKLSWPRSLGNLTERTSARRRQQMQEQAERCREAIETYTSEVKAWKDFPVHVSQREYERTKRDAWFKDYVLKTRKPKPPK